MGVLMFIIALALLPAALKVAWYAALFVWAAIVFTVITPPYFLWLCACTAAKAVVWVYWCCRYAWYKATH